MAEKTGAAASHLRWQGTALLPATVRESLTGRGAAFELVTEPVLGHDHVVFARRPRTLREMLDGQAAATPELPFLISPRRRWTYREAIGDIDATAVLLRDRYGVAPGDRVAIVAANHAEYAILMWAVVTLGAIVTSLNGWWTGPELEYGTGLTTPVLIAGDARRLARLKGGIVVPGGVPVRELGELQAEARDFAGRTPARPDITEDSPAVILFTSGTTGRPKGAVLSHRNIINFAMANRLLAAIGAATAQAPAAPPPPSCNIVSSPMFHVSGLIAVLVTGAAFPTTLVFPAPGAWDPVTWLELTARHKVTTWSGVPTQFSAGTAAPRLSGPTTSAPSARSAPAEPCSRPSWCGSCTAGSRRSALGNGYGMSETVGLGTLTGGEPFVAVPERSGPPSRRSKCRSGTRAATSAGGRIGRSSCARPRCSSATGTTRPPRGAAFDEGRWYRTGDFGRIAGGLLYLASRRRDLILRGGENVYPIEIENRLIEHPDIDDAAVIGVDHAELGQEVKAFVVRRPGTRLTAERVRAWCTAALAAYKVPARVEFRTALPYSQTGKLMKQALEREEKAR